MIFPNHGGGAHPASQEDGTARPAAEIVVSRHAVGREVEEPVCLAEFDSAEEARDCFGRAREGFEVPEDEGAYLVDLVVNRGDPDDIEGTFELDDLLGMTWTISATWFYPQGLQGGDTPARV